MTGSAQSTVQDFPQFGNVVDVDLEPVVGSEIGKRRPALIVSNNINNQFSNTITVLPITSQAPKKVYPFEVFVSKDIAGLPHDSRIKADQIRTVDKRRVVKIRGSLPANLLFQVDLAMKVHLNMNTP